MEELCQPSLNGRGGPIASIAIQATNFGLKNDMIQQDTSAQRSESSSSITSSSDTEITALKAEMAKINKNLMRVLQVNQQVKSVTPSYKTCGGPHSFSDCPATVGQTQNVYAARAYQGNSYQPQAPTYQAPAYQAPVYQPRIPQHQVVTTNEFTNFMKANDVILKNMQTNMTSLTNKNLELKNMFGQFMKMNTASSLGLGTLPGNIITNPKEELKGIITRSGTAYQGPTIPTTCSSLPPVVECETETTKEMVHPTNNGSTKDIQLPVIQTESPILNSEPVVAPIIEPVSAPDLNFNISFVEALILRPKFSPSIKSSLTNKDKLFELARTPLNEHCLAVLLKKLPEKLWDPGKFLIPCDFTGMAECLALADLGARINLMPLSVWNKLSLPELTPTLMTLELADRSISRPIGVAKDVYVKVGKFHFPADFVVVDFEADPRVPLILRRSFLKTGRALIDVFEGELTPHVGKEAITFNLDQTLRYSANYNDMTANRIDVIDMACEEYSQEVLGFSNVIASGNPTPYYDPIVSTTSLTLTPFGIKAFLNDDPSLSPPNQGNYHPQVRKELKICEAKTDKSSIVEPPEVELKDLPPHLEYVFLEGNDKFPVIITKDLSVEEKTALITDNFEPVVQHQRRVSPKIHDVIKNEVLKLLDAGLIYPISDSPWVSHVYCVPKNGGFTVVENEENELIPTRLVTGWRVCIDYRKLNEATRRDHFPLPFMDQMLERLAGNEYYCFLDGFLGYFQIPIDSKDPEKTTFTCPYGTFAYRSMPFGLCNAPGTFQRCMMAIFHDMIKKNIEIFMDDFLEKSHFMVKEGIILSHKISKNEIEVDKAKVDVIAKLPYPTTLKGICSFLGHVGFYRRFIKDFSKIARPMTRLFEKGTPFFFSKECFEAFQILKKKLTEAPILIPPDWDLPFELMCDASNFAIGAVLGQRQEKHFRPIHYARKTMTKAESNYTTTEKEMLAVVYAFEKFRSYLIMNKSIVYTDHSTLKYLFAKKDYKARLLRVYTTRKPLTFSRLATMDPPGDIVAQTTLPRRMHFCNDQFAKVMLKYGVTQRLATSYHPQTSGQVEALKHANFDLQTAGDHRKVQLNELNELRDQAYETSLIYKEKTKRIHDSKIKDRVFNIGDRVLVFNSRLKIFSGKLKSRWSRPFTISHVFSYGTVELSQPDGANFKVNGHRLKYYFGEDIPKMVVPDL
uniref:RNA-directed DNA polymerase n=1 Tax=Tanacetum cinerariifolium TaxID=118510 RepID=A0A6L2LWC7_TANCI|nr:DNA-directed DNA polymerase [Tanacetum cinerariifolium]